MQATTGQMAARDDRSGINWAVITPSANDLAPVPGRLFVTVDCDVTMMGGNGVSVTFPLKAGVEYDLSPVRITNVNNGASVIAIYTVQ